MLVLISLVRFASLSNIVTAIVITIINIIIFFYWPYFFKCFTIEFLPTVMFVSQVTLWMKLFLFLHFCFQNFGFNCFKS